METTIGDTCYVTDGAHAKVERLSDGILYLTSKNIGVGKLLLDNVDYISEEDFGRLFSKTGKAQRRLEDGDVLTGIIGTFGNAYRYKSEDRFGVSSAVAVIRPNKGTLDSDFLLYVITSPKFKATLAAYKSGSVQGYTNLPTIRRLPLTLPPIRVQECIAHILGTLDAKIELNRRMDETLESMAQALFKSWFVDFDPVIDNALAAGNPIPEPLRARAETRRALGDQRKPLPDEIQKLFPDAFVFDDEMGWVPNSWNIKKWGEIATLEYGKSLKGYRDSVGSVRVWGTNGSIGWCDTPLCDSAGIIIGRKGAYRGVHYSPDPFFVIDTAFYLRPIYPFELKWAYYELLKLDINGMDSGSAIPSTSREDFYSIPVCVPPNAILEEFGNLLKDWCDKRYRNENGSEALTKLRDTLLPKLLSGELRIPDAEKLVAESL
ncbi:restriction endonuclease subunit S [Bremerella cremea]|uniref:restriction endonuclease subunit S n=1 Tax=Bremerella cremea TaxID=1031537 RepID=UPI0031E9D365